MGRVGFGASVVQRTAEGVVTDVAVLAGAVPGRQTVPRAELWGTTSLLAAVPLANDFAIGGTI